MSAISKRVEGLRAAAELNQALLDDCIDLAGLTSLAARAVGIQSSTQDAPTSASSAASPDPSATSAPPSSGWLDEVVGAGDEGSKGAFVLAPPHHVGKTRKALHQVAREWSEEGRPERDASFGRLLRALAEHLPARPGGKEGGEESDGGSRAASSSLSARTSRPRVLVPGAGMGRLVLDVAAAGYRSVGCEFSYQMLLVGAAMLNGGRQWPVVPWAEEACNLWDADSQLRRCMVPDVMAGEVAAEAAAGGWELDMSMAAGEFSEAFAAEEHAGAFDAVAACFFLDTAVVPSEYLATVVHVLRPGGVLVGIGPLQFHWATPPACSKGGGKTGPAVLGADRWDRSVELTWEEMKAAMSLAGLRLIKEERVERVPYCSNPGSMRPNEYGAVLFVAERTSPS